MFLLFCGGSLWLVGGIGVGAWVIAVLLLPSFFLTVLALMVALADLLERPAEQFGFGGRLFWVILIALFNVLAFLPYWVFVARHRRGHHRGDVPSPRARSRT